MIGVGTRQGDIVNHDSNISMQDQDGDNIAVHIDTINAVL